MNRKAQVNQLTFSEEFDGGGNSTRELLARYMLTNKPGGGSPRNYDSVFDNQPSSQPPQSQSAPYTVDEKTPHNASMSTVSKDLLDARLEAIEARMDARVAGMSAKLDATLAEIQADRQTNNHRFTRMESDVHEVKTALATLSDKVDQRFVESAKAVTEQVKGIKSNIWFGVATTIASVLAVLAVTYAAFDSGRETSKSIAEATARMEKLQKLLEDQAKSATQQPLVSRPATVPPAPPAQAE